MSLKEVNRSLAIMLLIICSEVSEIPEGLLYKNLYIFCYFQ